MRANSEPGRRKAHEVCLIYAWLLVHMADTVRRHVKALVGEVDFSFHAVKSSRETTDSSSIESEESKGKLD